MPDPRGSFEAEGDVRFHHVMPELWVLDARGSARKWEVYHQTYSFCLADDIPPTLLVKWRYARRLYVVDRDHITMAMQPGELHANLRPTPPVDFIVVQVGEDLMRRVAGEIGGPSRGLNINHPLPGTGHPLLTQALRHFRRDLCATLFGPQGQCTCSRASDRHIENLVELVSVFVEHCAENAAPLPPPSHAAATVRRAIDYLRAHYNEPYDLTRLARAAGCRRFYLPGVFKRATGVRPSDYQNRILASKACRLIAQAPDKTLEVIAHEMGWPGRPASGTGDKARLMIRHFQRSLGVTPGEFRASLRDMSDADWAHYERLRRDLRLSRKLGRAS